MLVKIYICILWVCSCLENNSLDALGNYKNKLDKMVQQIPLKIQNVQSYVYTKYWLVKRINLLKKNIHKIKTTS